jgi:predicted acetyltransferase
MVANTYKKPKEKSSMAIGEIELTKTRAGESGPLEAVLSGALHSPTMGKWIELLGVDNFREVRVDGQVAAGLGYVRAGQWFGGANVPCVGITAVGVAPEYRGSGLGSAMVRLMVEELHNEGVPLSSLYPATLPFYQSVGYERAGQRVNYHLAIDAIDIRESRAELAPVTEADYPTIYDLYDRRARLSSGNMARPEWMWKRKLESSEHRLFRYLLVQDGAPVGYLIYTQADRETPITLLDVCVLTPEAGKRILTLLRAHRSIQENVTWWGGPFDPLVMLLREPMVAVSRLRATPKISLDWMLRLVDVPKALTARGYPAGLDATLHFDVRDDLLPANSGRMVLEVSGGHGEVSRGGEGRIRVDVRDLAALYSGYMSPAELTVLGTLQASPDDMGLLGAVFASPRPWLADMF